MRLVKRLWKRSLGALITLFCVATLTFLLMHAIPGDPFTQEQALPPEILQSLRAHYHLDDPLLDQYGHYLLRLAHGDLGPSLRYPGLSVHMIIQDYFPISFSLGIEALFLSLICGISLGAWAAMKENQWQDHLCHILTLLFLALPTYLIAALLQEAFWGIPNLPIARWGSFAHTWLPALSLSALPLAMIARLTRAHLLEVWRQPYILTARAKGCSQLRLLFRHGLRNALLPTITYLGPLLANILVGSFVVERIFAIPGLGQWFVRSIAERDYSVIMGVTLFYTALLLLVMTCIDLAYSWLDPRMRKGESRQEAARG